MLKKSKSVEISEKIRMEILGGKFDETRKLPSEHQLMRRFAVARETVRAALKTLKDRKLVDGRPGFGTFLSDHADVAAARKFAIVVPDVSYDFYTRICNGIVKGARQEGWMTLTASLGAGDSRTCALKAVEFAEFCKAGRVSGVFFQPLQFLKDSEKFNRTILRIFKESGIPVVLLDSDFTIPPERSEYDLVGVDNMSIGHELGRHLIEQGARRICYFSRPLCAPTSLLRGHGVALAVSEAGLRWTRDSLVFADPLDTRLVRRMFQGGGRRPDGIVVVNDGVAVKLLQTMEGIGVRVPQDCLMASINGEDFATVCNPPLTTASQPCEQIGAAAVKVMLQRLADPSLPRWTVYLQADIIKRQSSNGKTK